MIKYLNNTAWADATARLVMETIEKTRKARDACNVMLTGGRSAELLYIAWAALPEFDTLRNVHFYFGDERCVPPDHSESNYGLAMRTLFCHGVPQNCTVTRMAAERSDHAAAAVAYEQTLPARLDVLLLSVGEDGHIASLFPKSEALSETRRRVIAITAPKPPRDRLTVTPTVLAQASHVFVMAIGASKAAVFQRAQTDPQAFADLPARLVLGATWLLDSHCAQ
jgi:6-phosphogluconolactonase